MARNTPPADTTNDVPDEIEPAAPEATADEAPVHTIERGGYAGNDVIS